MDFFFHCSNFIFSAESDSGDDDDVSVKAEKPEPAAPDTSKFKVKKTK